MLEVPSDVDYDCALYKITSQGYQPIYSSNYGTSLQNHFGREQFSYNITAGEYLVVVGVASGSGYSSNPFTLLVTESSGAGLYEPNDNINQANTVAIPTIPDVKIDDNIDCAYDWDFYKLNFAGTGEYRIDFSRLSGNGSYAMELYQVTSSGGLSYLGLLNQNEYTFLNMSGTYYVRVLAASYTNDSGQYRIAIRKKIASVQIDSIWSPPSWLGLYGPNQKCDPNVFGVSQYVVQNEAKVRGIAKDAQGNPVPNASLYVRFDSTNNDYPHVYDAGYTNSSGQFDIHINIPESYWTQDAWYNNCRFKYSPGTFIVWRDHEGGDDEQVIHLYQVVCGG